MAHSLSQCAKGSSVGTLPLYRVELTAMASSLHSYEGSVDGADRGRT